MLIRNSMRGKTTKFILSRLAEGFVAVFMLLVMALPCVASAHSDPSQTDEIKPGEQETTEAEPKEIMWVKPVDNRLNEIASEAIYYLPQHLDFEFNTLFLEITEEEVGHLRAMTQSDFMAAEVDFVIGVLEGEEQVVLFAKIPGEKGRWAERPAPLEGKPTMLAPLWATIWGNLIQAVLNAPVEEEPEPEKKAKKKKRKRPKFALAAPPEPRKRLNKTKFETDFAAAGSWLPGTKGGTRIGLALDFIYYPAPPFAADLGLEFYPPFEIEHDIYDMDFLSIPSKFGGRYYWSSNRQEMFLTMFLQARYTRFRLEDPTGSVGNHEISRTSIAMGGGVGYHYYVIQSLSLFVHYNLFWIPRGQQYYAKGERLHAEPSFGMTVKLGLAWDWLK